MGSDNRNPIELTCHDTHVHDSKTLLKQDFIREAKKNTVGGSFTVEFEQSGKYQIEISRWPFKSGLAISESAKGRPATISIEQISEGKSISFVKGGVQIGAWKQEEEPLKNDKSIVFEGTFAKGKTDRSAWFTAKEKKIGVLFG